LPDNHPYRMVRAVPAGPHAPEIWVLGSSDYGAQLAAYFGLPYCYAYFFNEGKGADRALELYRENFRPSPLYPKPHSSIAVWAFAAETESEADYHYWPRAIQRLMFYRGQFIPMPTPEAAAEYQADEADRGRIERGRKKAFCGTPDVVVARLREEAAALGVDELAIVSSAYDAAARQKSYTLMAREFGLSGALNASS
jgi:luciferase family oxidoreductase group 1